MVQVPNFHPTREGWQQQQTHQQRQQHPNDERHTLPYRQHHQQPSALVHDRLLTVTQALRDCAGLPVKEYALVAILDNGQDRLFCSNRRANINYAPVLEELRRKSSVVDEQASSSGQDGSWTANGPDTDSSFNSHFSSGSDTRRRRQARPARADDSDDSDSGSRRKRSRPSGVGRRGSDDTPGPITNTRLQTLEIGDSAKVTEFYTGRFRDLQQTACKVIGKAFVKLVEPKKQTHHPYTKGDSKSPPWWPPTSGDDRVRHKEPDHLLKHERVRLCVWILKMIVKPNREQPECIRHLHINVKKLEEVTNEKMNEWFNEPAHPRNKDKRKYLKEIFKIARQEERYLDGAIDATTRCAIMFGADSRRAADYESSEDEGSDTEADNDDEVRGQTAGRGQMNHMAPAPMILQTQPEEKQPGMFQPSDRRAPPIGYVHQPQPEHQQSFDVGPMYEQPRMFGFQSTLPTDQERRNFGSPVYSSTSSSYAWTPSPVAMGTTPPNTFYTTSPQMANPPANAYQMAPMPSLTPTPSMPMLPPLHGHFDPSPRFDMSSINVQQQHQLRSESLGHAQLAHPSTSFHENIYDSQHYSPVTAEFKNPHLQNSHQ